MDVVSVDIKMPRLDGFEVLSLIRSHEHSRRAPSVPVIAITGNVSIEDKAQAITGLALAIEQQGSELLRQMLTRAYRGEHEAAAEGATRPVEASK